MNVSEYQLSVSDIQLTGSVARLVLTCETPGDFLYKEGQYLNLVLPGGHKRAYSFASPCRADGTFELHVRLHEGGRFSEMLRKDLQRQYKLTAVGPFGDCLWHPPAHRDAPILMLATGTGIAPLKALLEAELPHCKARVWLYWGCREAADMYLRGYFESLSHRYSHFNFVPVLSRDGSDTQAACGHVQDAAARHHADLSRSHVYACGSPRMIEAAKALLTESHFLRPENFHVDAFEAAWEHGAFADAAPKGEVVELWVTVKGERKKQLLPGGQSLMLALSACGLMHGVCGGRQSCGTCRVVFQESGFRVLKPPSRSEQRLLNTLNNVGPYDRLACQMHADSQLSGAEIVIPDNPVNRMKQHIA
ncbi:MAG: 2Fe-2S iron-sulfur cluster binding domain-containing protein [Rhodospirillales bacterium]|nr:2Fe-2S iron-sulfur cluster binding domain-containing protein [Rhodospirillales bacterium]